MVLLDVLFPTWFLRIDVLSILQADIDPYSAKDSKGLGRIVSPRQHAILLALLKSHRADLCWMQDVVI